MSSPRNISAAADGLRLASEPASYLAARRVLQWQGSVSSAASGTVFLPASARGSSLWVQAQLLAWSPCSEAEGSVRGRGGGAQAGGTWGLLLLASPDGQEATAVSLNASSRTVAVDASRSSLDPSVGKAVYSAAAAPSSPGFSGLSVLLDTSLLEVFVHSDIQGEAVVTARAYPTRQDSDWLAVRAELLQGAAGLCVQVQVFGMP
jgi:hypothetical protein